VNAHETLGMVLAVVPVAIGVFLGRRAPTWSIVAALVLVPLRVETAVDAYPAVLLLIGALAGRVGEILAVLREEPVFAAATLALPTWAAASVLWARQPMFVPEIAAKWFLVAAAAWLAAADRSRSPRALVAGFFIAIVPSALWGAAERLAWVAPRGDTEELHFRLIDYKGSVRGRALFWHPNRLGEFVEQGGLLLGGAGLGGVAPWMCLVGVLAAAVGVWGTGSMGSLAALGSGLCALAGMRALAFAAPRTRGAVVGSLGMLGLMVAGYAWVAHDGLGTRATIYDYALDRAAERPWIGHGAGSWPLLVGQASLEISRYWFRSHAHSLPLHVGVELGVVGVVLLAAFFGLPLAIAIRRFPGVPGAWRWVGIGAAVACAALFFHNFVHYFIRDAADGIVTGILLGTTVAVARRAKREAS
jgi:hypothetical protein